ncbi:hypothetical protein KC363_g2098 [Hortaea werneckii]|uniref:Uncharacterized protein n=1 Tax=Hortaea werneckii TaxID=91943 RepID=A0A3M7FXV3_HORWE|nr:hypothetical protein KC361_g885 [Hortaea werneckii]KAI6888857.1 hypothetical protein KC325_g988 [Hortaea werneckii]KAI7000342.1 hypothetical protein KC359_g1277 [Hortaea werneckii]KAI7149915.1 hypothetical protein KC344_g546 [Hortaea werneckii]KAI7179659.1 hypothetical protein KC360_g653 [Hortaea werneckii]
MSGANNASVAMPGQHWSMLWPQTFDDFQLDIVGFLAILGEGSVAANAQVAALSRLFYLPRLIPAPQALLWPSRPSKLPPTTAVVTGVYSGNVKEHIHHLAHVLLSGDEMPTYTVRCVRITKKSGQEKVTRLDTMLRGLPARKNADPDATMRDPSVKAKALGPLTGVVAIGLALSITLFIVSIVFGDGMSMIATILLSLLSTVVGIGNKWNLKLPQPAQGVNHSDGDVVIRYPRGSYLVVRCTEQVARELYFAPEEIEYNVKSPGKFRIISLVGTLMLMLGVIALANARLPLQFAWAGAYIIINIAHWIAAALPASSHWDLSCYTIEEESIALHPRHEDPKGKPFGGPDSPNFTEALWKAIMFTKETAWVRPGKAAPQTRTWDQWLEEAQKHAMSVKSRKGLIKNKKFGDESQSEGLVWNDPDQWDPKKAWNELHEANKTPREQKETKSDASARLGAESV